MNEELRVLTRQLPTSNMTLETVYSSDEMTAARVKQLGEPMLSDINIDYVTDLVIARASPSRDLGAALRTVVVDKVRRMLTSWRQLGKFNSLQMKIDGRWHSVTTMSPLELRDHYNTEFVAEFANTILSVVNPDGLFVQQERILKFTSKPIPFYERAIFRRLNDWNLEPPRDESENLFYKMDKNPRLSEAERQKN